MLAVCLLLLKIIGIALLSVLGLAVLLLLAVLFVPVRYRVAVKRSGLEGDPPVQVRANATWLLHILNLRAVYPSAVYLRVRILIFTLWKLPQTKSPHTKPPHRKKDTEEKCGGKEEDGAESLVADEQTLSEDVITEPDETEDTHKKNILHTIREFYDKIKGIIHQIRDKISNMENTLQSAKDSVDHYRSILASDAFKASANLAIGQLSGIFKSISPKKCRIYIEEGMDDPAVTAEILAIYGMFYPWLYDKVTVVGNFDETVLKADVFIKGRITVFRIVYAGIRIYFNKQVKSLIRMMKKEDRS